MKKILLMVLALTFFSTSAQAACENIKGIIDAEDGAVYYTPKHRLYSFIDTKSTLGGKTFCSKDDAKKAEYKPAKKYFSNSTARVVECVETGFEPSKCGNYVMGIFRSLSIYDKVCGTAKTASREDVLKAFAASAKTNEKNMDIAKYYGTTNALMDAYPCSDHVIANK